jgi:hypothetical protein
MARSVVVLITVTDRGHIKVDVRGPYSDKNSINEILDAAKILVEQGNFGGAKPNLKQEPPSHGYWGAEDYPE